MSIEMDIEALEAELAEAEAYINDCHDEIRDLTQALNEALHRLDSYDVVECESDEVH